jgi:tRNA A58 N-methylase Trm61
VKHSIAVCNCSKNATQILNENGNNLLCFPYTNNFFPPILSFHTSGIHEVFAVRVIRRRWNIVRNSRKQTRITHTHTYILMCDISLPGKRINVFNVRPLNWGKKKQHILAVCRGRFFRPGFLVACEKRGEV